MKTTPRAGSRDHACRASADETPQKPGEAAPKQKGGQKTKSVDPDERKESPDSGSNPRTERQKKTWGIYTRLEPTLAVRSEPARGRQSPTTWPRIRRCGSLKPAQPCHVELVPAYNLANPHRGSSFPLFAAATGARKPSLVAREELNATEALRARTCKARRAPLARKQRMRQTNWPTTQELASARGRRVGERGRGNQE